MAVKTREVSSALPTQGLSSQRATCALHVEGTRSGHKRAQEEHCARVRLPADSLSPVPRIRVRAGTRPAHGVPQQKRVPCSQEAHTQKTSAGALIGRFNSHSNRCDSSESEIFRPDPWRHPGRRHQADPRGQRRLAWGVARRPSCTRGPAPDVGRTSRSTLCVLRRKRTRRVWRSNVVARINVKSC